METFGPGTRMEPSSPTSSHKKGFFFVVNVPREVVFWMKCNVKRYVKMIPQRPFLFPDFRLGTIVFGDSKSRGTERSPKTWCPKNFSAPRPALARPRLFESQKTVVPSAKSDKKMLVFGSFSCHGSRYISSKKTPKKLSHFVARSGAA